MGIPMTAREQLLRAREAGHELFVDESANPNFPDAPTKYWLNCTCGYRSTARRSRAALNQVMTWHLGKAIAEAEPPRVNGL
jgi:hypothetical protein